MDEQRKGNHVATPVTMPQLGETVIEGTVTKWLKKEGETVARDEPLFEISTDKVDTEVPSPLAGTLVQIKVQEGETVAVGTELAHDRHRRRRVRRRQRQRPRRRRRSRPRSSSGRADARPRRPARRWRRRAPAEERSPEVPAASAVPPAEPPTAGRPRRDGRPPRTGTTSQILSPLVRRLADEHGVDLSQVTGTGTGGRITKYDVEEYIKSGGGGAAPAAEAPRRHRLPPRPRRPRKRHRAPAPERPEAPAGRPRRGTGRCGARAAAHRRPQQWPARARSSSRSRGCARRSRSTWSRRCRPSARAWNLVEVNMENVVRARATQVKDAFKEREGINLTYMPFSRRRSATR